MNDKGEHRERNLRDEHIGGVEFQYHSEPNADKRQVSSVDEVFEQAIDVAQKWLERSAREGGDFMPVAFVYTPVVVDRPQVSVCLLAKGFSGYEGKRKVGKALAEFARKYKAAAVVLATDGWMPKSPDGLEGEAALREWQRKAGPPGEHPDRLEGLTVNCIWPDGTATGWIRQYVRKPMGHLVPTDDGERGIKMGQVIEWGELHDGRTEADNRIEQSIIPAWQVGGAA